MRAASSAAVQAPCVGTRAMHWITDPSYADHDLADFLCGPSVLPNASFATSCPNLRNCTFDSSLASTLNATCASTGGCYACLHKGMWPLMSGDVSTACLLFVCGVLAGASGIGGGGLNVPLLMLSGGFLVTESVPLSHVAVFGNAIAQNLVNFRRRHPHDPSRALIDYDVPLLLLPAQLGGNSLGVLLSPVLPATAVELLACGLLLYAASKTLITAVRNYRRETTELAACDAVRGSADAEAASWGVGSASRATQPSTATKALLDDRVAEHAAIANQADSAASGDRDAAAHPPTASPNNEPAYAGASPVVDGGGPRRKLGALVLLWLLLVLVFVASRSTGASSHRVCTPTGASWLLAQVGIIVVAVTAAARTLRREQTERDRRALLAASIDGGAPGGSQSSARGDLRWTGQRTRVLPLVGSLVGCVAGLLGLGGGELMAPLLLIIGMLPTVASATSACMVLFTSSSNIAHYLVEGVLAPDPGYVAAAAAIGFTSALIGRLLALRLVQRLAHPSLIAFILAGLLYLALALLTTQLARTPIDWTFAPLCRG